MRTLARKHQMVLVVPIYERSRRGSTYNTAAVIDADASTWASTERPTSPTASPASGRSSTSGPGNLGYPVFETAHAKVGVYICYDRHFPEGARAPWA